MRKQKQTSTSGFKRSWFRVLDSCVHINFNWNPFPPGGHHLLVFFVFTYFALRNCPLFRSCTFLLFWKWLKISAVLHASLMPIIFSLGNCPLLEVAVLKHPQNAATGIFKEEVHVVPGEQWGLNWSHQDFPQTLPQFFFQKNHQLL